VSSPNTRFTFKDQTVVVTGGSRGIGREICKAFAQAGANVYTCSRRGTPEPSSDENAEASSARKSKSQAGTIQHEIVDVRDAEATEAWLGRCAQRTGSIDVLVNNAGGAPSIASSEVSPKLTNKILELNLNAPLILSQQAYSHLNASADGGAIVNIVSVSSTRPTPGSVAYGAAKSGLMNATRSLAVEWGPGIRVNCIVAGLVATELTEGHYGDDESKLKIATQIPAKRFARPDEIARACLFLAAKDSTYISGAALEVHGGGEWPPTIPMAPESSVRGGSTE
jgi:NAD(P)-dependent dehydrogenase (short-subunit alcohol dehydrogenase family)